MVSLSAVALRRAFVGDGVAIIATHFDEEVKVVVTVKSHLGNVIEPRSGTKIHSILKQLQSKNGADIQRICKITGWQAHSVRAAISDLRKRGYPITQVIRKNGKSAYAIREA